MQARWLWMLAALSLPAATGCGQRGQAPPTAAAEPVPETLSPGRAPGPATPEVFRVNDAPYLPGQHGKGKLELIDGIPVLTVQGTPEEIGGQIAHLARAPLQRMVTFPKQFLTHFGYQSAYPALTAMATSMAPRFPDNQRQELEALAKHGQVEWADLVAGNAFTDIKKVGGCSTLIVAPERSATGAPLFGRNLDYNTLGFLHHYSLVTVYRPEGKHAFASIGFPGLVGCVSGMNDAGLAVAVLEIYASRDGSPRFDAQGTPYAMCFRRLLEECTTVEEAATLLRSMKRTTWVCLAVCDQQGGAVFEITPKSVIVRPPVDGVCPCTNHFRSDELGTGVQCRRYPILADSKKLDTIGVADVRRLLHATNQGKLTFQTMIFEPRSLRLHLAIGAVPSSALEPKLLNLAPLLGKDP